MTEQPKVSDKTSIRRAGRNDQPVVQAISKEAFAIYLAMWNDVPRPGVIDLAQFVERGEAWLLEEAGEPVGLIILEPRPDHLWVFSLAVRPDRQGSGHATRLLDFAVDRARAAGVGQLRLDVNDRMDHSVAVYRHHGFVATGRSPHRTRPDHFMLAMVRELTS